MTTFAEQPTDITSISANAATKLLIQRLEYWFRGKKKKYHSHSSKCSRCSQRSRWDDSDEKHGSHRNGLEGVGITF